MENVSVFSVGVLLCLTSLAYFARNTRKKEPFLAQIGLRGKRTSFAMTPPQSPTSGQSPQLTHAPLPDLVDSFPPDLQDGIACIAEDLDNGESLKLDSAHAGTLLGSRKLVPMTVNIDTCEDDTFTPTGISVRQIKALGDFPDYAKLSGVPLPQAYATFDLKKALARPYRPFRWPYHQTMSFRKLEPDWLLELESKYRDRISQRKDLYAQHGNSVLQWLPGSEFACKELMEINLQFLCARYPQHFSLSTDKTTFTNEILGSVQDIRAKHPLLVILDNVPEDFAIMIRDSESGKYFLRAGVICSALGWNLGSKIGLQLSDIHTPIPHYAERMRFSMDRYFAKMRTNQPIQRGSWGLEIDTPLFMPPGDPHEVHRASQSADLTLDRCHLRVDWQTLRRLPLSGAIVFNFKGLFTPVKEFRDEPFVPSLVLKVLKEGDEKMMEYKNAWHVEHVVIPALEKYEREQIANGIVPHDWGVATLEEAPWFPDWKEKWHRQQGF